jgi:hypothetical protein
MKAFTSLPRTVRAVLFILALSIAAVMIVPPDISRSQTTTTVTTITADVNETQNYVIVASATTVAAGRIIYIDREAMRIQASYSSGTTVPVDRGREGTMAVDHDLGAIAYVGAADYFMRTDLWGGCTNADYVNQPRINTTNGNISYCKEGIWTVVNLQPVSYLNPYELISTPADYTALLSDTFINFTDVRDDVELTLPSVTGIRGKKYIITIGDNVTTPAILVYGVNGQTFASNATSSARFAGAGAAARVMSVQTANNSWGWVTW